MVPAYYGGRRHWHQLLRSQRACAAAGEALDCRQHEDGIFTVLEEDEAAVAAAVARRPGAQGVVSFNVLAARADRLGAVPIDGVAPSLAAIAEGGYRPARAFHLYVKSAHLGQVPGLRGYLAEITGEAASGPGGYLTARGLVALPPTELQKLRAALR